MKKNHFLEKRLFLGWLMIFLPINLISCSSNSDKIPSYKLHPNYLLEGEKVNLSDSVYDYFDIGNDEYAVALKNKNHTFDEANIIIPETAPDGKPVTGIWRDAFAGNNNKKPLVLPSTIKTIDYEAFISSKITSVVIPASVNAIGDAAFYSCDELTSVRFNNSYIESSGSATDCLCFVEDNNDNEDNYYSSLNKIPAFCFFKCLKLKELVLPQNISEVSYEAFNGCSSLSTTLSFQKITSIKSRAFQGCSSLSVVYLPSHFFDNNGEMGLHAFNYCDPSLEFHFAGDNVADWISNNPKWGWYSDVESPASKSYTYIPESGDIYYLGDWIYTTSKVGDTDEYDVTITSYVGAHDNTVKSLSIPENLPFGVTTNKVRYIDIDALSTVRSQLERLYLPRTLRKIDNSMFQNYDNLRIIDDSGDDSCQSDKNFLADHGNNINNITPRIDISALKDLEIIGDKGFLSMPKCDTVEELHLPSGLVVVGSEAFGGTSGPRFSKVRDFKWDYDEENAKLKIIGHNAFYKLGQYKTQTKGSNFKDFDPYYQNHLNDDGTHNYEHTTLIFPKTLSRFMTTSADVTKYGLTTAYNGSSPAHAFAGCPLIRKVVFKGGAEDETDNLFLHIQCFSFCESLQTIVFEERVNHSIYFHTENGKWTESSVGSNGGRSGTDFRGDPGLQTFVIGNQHTSIYVQNFAFQGNSRGVLYFSNSINNTTGEPNNVYGFGDITFSNLVTNNGATITTKSLDQTVQWRTIGNEEYYTGGSTNTYPGFCYTEDKDKEASVGTNRFGIDQKMPVYGNVHYSDTINDSVFTGGKNVNVEVGLGNTNEFIVKNKCAFLASGNRATLTKYLFDRYDSNFSGTAIVPTKVGENDEYTVDKIGDSAFSAAYCDNKTQPTIYTNNTYKNLVAIELPDTIERIGDYAFFRAYGVTKISSYSNGSSARDYEMPTSLSYIGQNAFAFTNVEKVLKIPNTCLFYENTVTTEYETSVFANNLSLRKITFGSSSLSSSPYYVTSTYVSDGGETNTSAIYSTNDSGVTKNKDCLLMILNRDQNDYNKVSENPANHDIESTADIFFTSLKNTNPHLYGAFKMGYWIKSLTITPPTRDKNGNILPQPLISAVCKSERKNGVITLTDSPLYLNLANTLYADNACDLSTVSLGQHISGIPAFSFDGCENLLNIQLPRSVGERIPDGVFSNVNINRVYIVPTSANGDGSPYSAPLDDGGNPIPNVLDLTYCGYSAIGKQAFYKSNITKVIAPAVDTFTIDESAFAECSSLKTLDLSNVTGKIVFEKECFCKTSIQEIIFPTDPSVQVEFKERCFAECKSLTTLNLPTNTTKLGRESFKDCTSLANVVASANLTNLTSIDYGAFWHCESLVNFDFAHLTALTTIGDVAFEMANTTTGATICPNGVVSLPSTLTKIGQWSFKRARIVDLTFNSSSLNVGQEAFSMCDALQIVRFTNHDCVWTNYNNKVFSDWGDSSVQLMLPTGFDLNNSNSNMLVNSRKTTIYTFKTITQAGVISHYQWRQHTTGSYCTIVYYVSTSSELLTGDALNTGYTNNEFWKLVNNNIVYLGKPVSVSNGVITFDTNHTLDADGNIA